MTRFPPLVNGTPTPTGGPIPTFDVGDVINEIEQTHGLLWVLMITSAENRRWPGDVPLSDLGLSGLSADSVVRTAKIATIETKEAERIGVLPKGDREAVRGLVVRSVG